MVRLLTRAEAASELRVSTRSLRRLSIPVVRIGRKPLYDLKDLVAYQKKQTRWEFVLGRVSPTARMFLEAIGWRDDVPDACCVYFIQCDAYVKIGHSVRPEARMDVISTSSPHDPVLLGHIRGGLHTEAALHKAAAYWRHRREWFHLEEDLLTAIKDLCASELELEARK